MPKIKIKGQTVQTGECPQTNGYTRTRTLPNVLSPLLYAVDNKSIDQHGRRKCSVYVSTKEFHYSRQPLCVCGSDTHCQPAYNGFADLRQRKFGHFIAYALTHPVCIRMVFTLLTLRMRSDVAHCKC